MPETFTFTGMWTTDEAGEIVFVRFPVPLVVKDDCEDDDA